MRYDGAILSEKHFCFWYNPKLMEKCSRLSEYSRFIQILNECKENEKDLKKATYAAVERGIEEGILLDILIRQKAEVCAMVLTEYNEKKHMKTLFQEGYDSGYGSGYGIGYGSGYDNGIIEDKKIIIRNLLVKGASGEQIREIVVCDQDLVEQVKSEMLQS